MTIQIQLPENLKATAERRAAESGHASLDEYLQGLIRDDAYGGPEHLRVTSREDFEAKIREGLNSPASEWTAADFDEMRRQFREPHGLNGNP